MLSLINCFCCILTEDALRNVSMFFRSEPTWSVVQPLKDIGTLSLTLFSIHYHSNPTGWRIRKQYYLIASKMDKRIPEHMLSWVSPLAIAPPVSPTPSVSLVQTLV